MAQPAADPIARLIDERNAAVREYHMVMSERDCVHREMERLQESLTEATKRAQSLEQEKKAAQDELQRVKRDATALQLEKERVLQECYELRLRYNVSTKYSSKVADESPSPPLAAIRSSLSRVAPSPGLRGWAFPGAGLAHASKGHAASGSCCSLSASQARDLSLVTLNQELDAIRLKMAELERELLDSRNEAEMSKRRRDWAIAEKKKMGLEREAMKQLSEGLRKERNQRDRELAKALVENEELRRQLHEAVQALHEQHTDKLTCAATANTADADCALSSAACSSDALVLPSACSRDSAIYADLLEPLEPDPFADACAGSRSRVASGGHSRLRTSPLLVPCAASERPKIGEVRDILISNRSVEPLGIGIFWNEKNGSIFVSAVSEHSVAAQAGLQVGDQLLDINGVNMRCQATRKIASTVLCQTKKSEDDLKIRVQYNPDKFDACYPKLRDDGSRSGLSSPLPVAGSCSSSGGSNSNNGSSNRCQLLAGETGRRKEELRETCVQACKKL